MPVETGGSRPMTRFPMSGRADVVGGSRPMDADPELGSGVGPASMKGAQVDEAAWPLRSYLELGAFPTAVPCARLHARYVVLEWGFAALAEVVELIVSELVTNAVQATEALTSFRHNWRFEARLPPVQLRLCSDGNRVVIQVWDGNQQLPIRQDAGLEAEGGRGLLLVESLSVEWGSHRPAGYGGKVVWAVVA